MRERKLASDDRGLGKFSRQPQGPLLQGFELVRGPIKPFVSRAADEEREVAPKWIESRQTVSPGKLEDASQSISHALV